MERQTYASDIAGHCAEITAWQIIYDLTEQLLSHSEGAVVRPSSIKLVDEGRFMLVEDRTDLTSNGFDAPEVEHSSRTVASGVWSIGASVFYIMMGCLMFNGQGGRRQTARSRIPYLRNGLPELSELVQRCLHYNPRQRPTLKELHEIGAKNLNRCKELINQGPKIRESGVRSIGFRPIDKDFWPEEMIDTRIMK